MSNVIKKKIKCYKKNKLFCYNVANQKSWDDQTSDTVNRLSIAMEQALSEQYNMKSAVVERASPA